MKTTKFTKQFLLAVFAIYSFSVVGQSISGNISSAFSSNNLVYANVNIYKSGKLVANVLTDAVGNFNVKLDTGVYKCEINYAGFKTITKEIKVTSDEKSDFKLSGDEKSKFSSDKVEHYLTTKVDDYASLYSKLTTLKGISTTNAWGESKVKDTAALGKLTAGEINDFSKWAMWTDMAKTTLNSYKYYWKLSPENRYMVQLKDQNGLPLANAKVELLDGSSVIYTSKTDNTGKAELWEKLLYDTSVIKTATSIRVDYKGETKTIRNIKKFEKGVNTIVINSSCDQSMNVDIAMVVDATGSMQDEIEYLKYDLNSVIFKAKAFSSTLNLRFANIFYRDIGDAYVTQSQDFTSVLSESVAFTNEHNAGGGGDEPESVEIALDSAINRLSWNTDTRAKILFLVLDAPPHCTAAICEKMIDLCYKAAAKGIRIVPVTGSGTSKDAEYLMRCLSLATNGTYVFLTDHSGIGGSHTKPSTDSYRVEVLNDLLVRVIKSFTYMPDCQQQVTDMGVNLPDSQVVISNDMDSTLIDTTKPDSLRTIHSRDSLDIQWKFYPNPTNGIINIVSNKNIEELYISDLSGKLLQVVKNIVADRTTTVDLSEYSTGIYLIRYPQGKIWVSGKIVISH